MFGGGLGSQAAGSTVIERNLDRITIILALVFTFVTLALALMMDEQVLQKLPTSPDLIHVRYTNSFNYVGVAELADALA